MRDSLHRYSADPKLLYAHAKSVQGSGGTGAVLALNGGSSSIRFALYDATEPLRRRLAGKVDRVGLGATALNVKGATGQAQDSRGTGEELMIARPALRVPGLGAGTSVA